MNWYFDEAFYLLLLLIIPLLCGIMWQYLRWKNNKRLLFAEKKFHEKIFGKIKNRLIFPLLYFFALFFMIIAIADILSGSEEIKTTQNLNNVIFLLDVSNSMNAEDVNPNRLNRAQNIMINTMSQMSNDKVGIVIFAGEAVSVMPLTTDYNAAGTYVSGLSTNMIKMQGTDFLKGVEKSVEKFKNIPKGARKIILLSDGEDNEGNSEKAEKLAKSEGISIITVGIGTENGAPIPEYIYGQLMGYKQINGETIISRREIQALKNIASATDGDYIDGNNLDQSSAQILESLRKKSSASSSFIKSENAKHFYQYPLGISILFFILLLLFNSKKDFNI